MVPHTRLSICEKNTELNKLYTYRPRSGVFSYQQIGINFYKSYLGLRS